MCDCLRYVHFQGVADEVALFLVEAGRSDLSDKFADFLAKTLDVINAQEVMIHELSGHDG